MRSIAGRTLNETYNAQDFASQKWNVKVDSLWPWKDDTIDEYKQKVGFLPFYSSSGANQSPYGTDGATKLVIQMHSIFSKVSEMANHNKISIEEAMSFAELYRKAIRKTTEEICKQANMSEEAFYADSLIVADTVWGLVESILIRPYDRSVVADLIDWGNETFGQARELLNEVEKQAPSVPRIEEKDFYWSCIISLLLVGQFRSASNVLSLASDARHNMKIQRMMSLLGLFDYQSLHSDSTGEKLSYAQKQVNKHIDSFIDDTPLHFIAKLLIGDIQTFKQVAERLSHQWYELLPAFILFSKPAATVNDLGDLTMELYNAAGVNAPNSHPFLNNFIISLMKMQWIEALNDLASVASLLWLSVHLFDLILKIDDSRLTEEIETIRDTVFITYAKEVFRTTKNPKLIPCGVTYAFATKEYKYDFVEPFLIIIAENDGPKNPELIEILSRICQDYGFYQAFHEITLALACNALRVKDWSTALYWALQNESIDVLETISSFVLTSASPAAIKSLHVFKEANEVIAQSDGMKFLFDFHQFNISLEVRDIPKATGLLHDLIISNRAPSDFVHVLFDNIADVIDATNKCLDKEPLLNPEAITKLQRCLTLFQTQEEIRSQGSARKFDHYERIDKKLTALHAVLLNALALTALKT
jgi:hypothetical protein